MTKRPRKDEMKDILSIQDKLFRNTLRQSKETKSPEFDLGEFEKVLKNLKGCKSKDPDGYICELFKSDIIGSDLKTSLLMMFNCMKS